MSSRAERRIQAVAWMGVLALTACASTPPETAAKPATTPAPAATVVVGQGSDDVRSAINTSDQQIFNSEHARSADPTGASSTEGVP